MNDLTVKHALNFHHLQRTAAGIYQIKVSVIIDAKRSAVRKVKSTGTRDPKAACEYRDEVLTKLRRLGCIRERVDTKRHSHSPQT